MEHTNILILGGGVAGLVTAKALLDAGHAVSLVEAEATYRDRIRGEALHPWGAAIARKLDLVPLLIAGGGAPLPRWNRYTDCALVSSYEWSEDIPTGDVEWAVSHPGLQAALFADVAPRLVRLVRPGRVTAVRRSGSRSELDVATPEGPSTLAARLVIGADGARSLTRKAIGATMTAGPAIRRIGGILVRGAHLATGAAHQSSRVGEMAIAFPREDVARCYLVCGTDRAVALQPTSAQPSLFAALADHFPEGSFDGVVAAGPGGFFPAADTVVDRLAAPGAVLVGDAAGANDPSQGHGLSLSFHDAWQLRELLSSEQDWDIAVEEFARRRQAMLAPLRAHAGWTSELMMTTGAEGDALRERARRAREADPTLGGYAGIHAFGPAGLAVSAAAKRHFFGDDLPVNA